MAKKKKISTNKSKGIESISRNQSSDYKLISGWLLGLHNNDISEALENIPNYKYKFYVNLLNNPKIIFYLNEYMNDLFWFNKFSLMDWAKTFRLIMQHHGVTQTNQLFFSRYKKDEKVEFITLISEYVNDFGLDPLNNVEISHLYHLYNEDIIDEQDLEEIKFLLDKPSKLKKTKPIRGVSRKHLEKLSNMNSSHSLRKASYNSLKSLKFLIRRYFTSLARDLIYSESIL